MKPVLLATGCALAGAAATAALFVAWPSLTTATDGDDAPSARAPTTATSPEDVVMLPAPQARRAGIAVTTLAPASVGAVRHGLARALDISSLAAIQGEIVSARAALSASRADYARQHALAADDQSASTHAVETARAQAVADQARLTAALQRIGLEYGAGLARLSPMALRGLIHAIAAGQASLVRVDFADGAAPVGGTVHIGEGIEGAPDVRLIGPAAAADAHLQSAGSLAVVTGSLARELGAGRVLPVSMSAGGARESGVIIPRSAILRYQGGLWVYRVETGGYRRVELIEARSEPDGWFVREGLRPGDRVATGGVAVLLSAERGGEAPSEDD